MSLSRVALIFDDVLRPDTTGGYGRRALGELVSTVHFRPSELSRIPSGQFDAFIFIDDSLDYQVPDQLRPRAWWAIDTHLGYERCRDRALGCEVVFAAQRNGAERLQRDGLPAVWLPLACDPTKHQRHALPTDYDWCFVGHVQAGTRPALLRALEQRFPHCFVGERYFDEMARTYSASRLVLNQSVRDDVNMRVFEALACGSLLVTNDLSDNGQADLFQDQVHCATYRDPDELFEKVAYYLRHDDERERIAAAGRAEAQAKHTYRHRLQTVLAALDRHSTTTVAVSADLPVRDQWLDDIDFGIKTFLRPAALRRLLESILKFYPAAWVTIADDGNLRTGDDPESQACCRLIDEQPRFRLLSLPFGAGVSAGRNALVAATSRPYFLLLDDDFFFSEATRIERLWQRLQTEPDLGVVSGDCLDHVDGQRLLRPSGGTLHRINRTLVHDTAGWRDETRGLCDYIPFFALFRRAVIAAVPWDGEIGGEHYDYLLRLQSRGIRLAKAGDVMIEHDRFVSALDGYADRRNNYAVAQQEFLNRWGLDEVVQNDTVIIRRASPRLNEERATVSPASKPLGYYDHPRPEVLALIPRDAQRILDLGCGGGRLGELLKRRQTCKVWGVEQATSAAERARPRLDHVVVANLEQADLELPEGHFDCVVCADVLEHLREPRALLERCRRWLRPQGCLVASLPNVQHHSVITSLLAGDFSYEPAGLLDADHVRFFTRREIAKLLFRVGFEIAAWRLQPGDGYQEWSAAGRPGALRLGSLHISGLTPSQAEEFLTYQYVLRADLAPSANRGLTSIVLVTHNQLAYTVKCLESLRFRTDEPYELIVVDNGSSDGSVDYFRSQSDLRLIENPDNRGFPAAVNQGIQAARGQQILLLNNDTVVTTGWLRRMLDVLQRDPQVGLVGPVSNRVSGPQQVEANYPSLERLDSFAWEWGQQHAGETFDHDRLIGFCLLLRREVVDRIGLFDEQFGIGNFEDDDYCRRARQAGFRTVIAVDSFVHHFGHRTFVGAGIDLSALMAENQRKYRAKWDAPNAVPSADSIPEFSIGEAPDGGLLLQPRRPRLSLCMIVRDNAATIRPCLESIRPWVDEMIVVDTGSTDATPQICEELGAQVQHWPWRDDFSAARNESLRHATGEWLFWMDSDDTIPAECGRKLRTLVDGEHSPEMLGYVMQVHCPGPGTNGHRDVTVVDHVKLFRNRPDLRFEHRIHEQILPAIRRAGGDVAFTNIHVVHSGSDQSSEGRQRKLERDFGLLHLDLQERPDHPFVLFNLGMTHADCQQHTQAAQWLTRCLKVSRPEESHVRKTYAILASVLYQQRHFSEAIAVCQRGREFFPDDKELLFRQAMLEHQLGRLDDAAHSYHQVLDGSALRHFSSRDAAITGYKARHNLALVYEASGKLSLALQQWNQILADRPGYRPAAIAAAACQQKLTSELSTVEGPPQTATCGNSHARF